MSEYAKQIRLLLERADINVEEANNASEAVCVRDLVHLASMQSVAAGLFAIAAALETLAEAVEER